MKLPTEHTSVKLRVYPTDEQVSVLKQWFGNCRFVYNWALDLKKKEYDQWVTQGKPKNFKWSNLASLCNNLQQLRANTEWLQSTPIHSLQQPLRHLETGFKRMFKGVSEYPKFKSKNGKQSVHFTNIQLTSKHLFDTCVQIPLKFGDLKTVFHRPLPDGKLLRSNISKEGTRYFITFLYEVDVGYYLKTSDKVLAPKCGIDLGVVKPLTISWKEDDEFHQKVLGTKEKQKLDKLENRRKHYQRTFVRRLASLKSRTKVNKKTGEVSQPTKCNLNKARAKVQKAFQKEKDVRSAFSHTVSKQLAERFEIIKFEDLSLSNMTKQVKKKDDGTNRVGVSAKRGLNHSLLQLGLANVVTLTQRKAQNFGHVVQLVNPRYTSQRCSCCGCVSKLNRKSQAKFKCVECRFTLNADVNASRNILSRKPLVETRKPL